MERLDAGAALACTLNDAAFRERRALARRTLIRKVVGSKRISNGLVLSFEESETLQKDLGSFISLERQCCAFLDFVISDGKPTKLTISGPVEAAATIDMFAAAIDERD